MPRPSTDAAGIPGARIRPWRPTDRDAALVLFDGNVPGFFAASERTDFHAFLADPAGPYFVMEVAGNIVGCGGHARHPTRSRTAALCWGLVGRGDHGRGYGSALLRYRLACIEADPDIARVEIETTPMARGFFRRFGFVESRRLANGFAPGYDLVEMGLDLPGRRRGHGGPWG